MAPVNRCFSVGSFSVAFRAREQLRQTMIKPSLIPIEPQPLLRFENFRFANWQTFSADQRRSLFNRRTNRHHRKKRVGKSTFFKALLQQVPYDGTIYYQEQCLTSRSRPFDRMSWVMQNPQDQFLASSVGTRISQWSRKRGSV